MDAPSSPQHSTTGVGSEIGLDPAVALALAHLGEPITVGDLAAAAGYSETHFSRLFLRELGLTPARYLTAVRLAAAKQTLLEDSRAAVIDIAADVGFDSLSSFTRAFRQTVGLTPGGFRRLADQLADHSVRPFRVGQTTRDLTVLLHAPSAVGIGLAGVQRIHLWIGWFATPVPIGLPAAGVLVEGYQSIRLPLCPGYPWLLGFAVSANPEPQALLAPSAPIVGGHPHPITEPGTVSLHFSTAPAASVPMLPALPAMEPR